MRYKSEMCVCCHTIDRHQTPGMECAEEDCKCSRYDPMDGWDTDGNIDAEFSEGSEK